MRSGGSVPVEQVGEVHDRVSAVAHAAAARARERMRSSWKASEHANAGGSRERRLSHPLNLRDDERMLLRARCAAVNSCNGGVVNR